MEARTLGTQSGGALTFREPREKGQPSKEREERPERWEESQERAGPWGLWRERGGEGGGLACPYLKGLSLPWDCHLETPGGVGPRAQLLILWLFLPTQHPLSPLEHTLISPRGPHPPCMFPRGGDDSISLPHHSDLWGLWSRRGR